jgi:nicotinate-nucleotide pyrophosphorylase (carboxylating)
MPTFSAAEDAACYRLIDLALEEDLGDDGDRTSSAIIVADSRGEAAFVARREGIIAGLPAVQRTLNAIEAALEWDVLVKEGSLVKPGTILAKVKGPLRAILSGERTALNFLQRLSGVATLTRQYVEAVKGTKAKVLDTRKTIPGWRLLEKYAVRMGGGHNHRLGLYDGMLIKDNHLAGLNDPENAVVRAIELARRTRGRETWPIEIEVDNLDQLEKALSMKPEMILLDNMTTEQLRFSVKRRDAIAPETLLEASGGVNLHTIRDIAETGVDRISVGAITHSAPALDIALDYVL